jgi:transcription initiation factor IIE alpha subunit
MKKLVFLSIALAFTSTCIFGQKAGKVDTTKHATFYSCPKHPEATGHKPGKCPKCGKKLNLTTKEQMKAEVVKLYTCPMHPEVALDKEGNCPKCGKPLVEKKTKVEKKTNE